MKMFNLPTIVFFFNVGFLYQGIRKDRLYSVDGIICLRGTLFTCSMNLSDSLSGLNFLKRTMK